MKTIHFNFAKSLCAFLFVFFSFLTVSAGHYGNRWVDDEKIIVYDGFVYELNYDVDSIGWWSNATATLICRETYWDSISQLETVRPLQYWSTDSILFLPPMVGSVPVTAIKGTFTGCNDIKTVYIPYTVTSIERGVFAGSSLERIVFDCDGDYNNTPPISFGKYNPAYGDGMKYNGEFMNCKRLTSVVFYRPLKNIPSFMFCNCPKLESIDFYIDYTSFLTPNEMSIDSIGDYAFNHCESLRALNIPQGVTTAIGNYAFSECHQLDGITLNPTLQRIGNAAFINCRSLTSINRIPDAITKINDYTFYDCRSLTNMDLNNVTRIGEHAFAGCNKLSDIDLTEAQEIGYAAFLGGKTLCSVWYEPHPYISTADGNIAYREESWGTDSTNLGSFKKITIGKDVSELKAVTFFGHTPDTIICMAPVPPIITKVSCFEYAFNYEAYDTTILSVPNILVNEYREAYEWGQFAHIEGYTVLGNGDVNGDGRISISDVTALIDKILDSQGASINLINADVNGDGKLSIGDVTALINLLLNMN